MQGNFPERGPKAFLSDGPRTGSSKGRAKRKTSYPRPPSQVGLMCNICHYYPLCFISEVAALPIGNNHKLSFSKREFLELKYLQRESESLHTV